MITALLTIAMQATSVAAAPPSVPTVTLITVAPAADPAKAAIARRIAAKLLPDGTYRTMMKTVMDQVTGSMTDQMFNMPIANFAKMGGAKPADIAKLGPATMRQVMTVMDPAFDQRIKITMRVMTNGMGDLMTEMEPEYRAGLADALTTRFSLAQLSELDRFFSTPTGSAYAAQSMLIYADPAMMRRMQTMMPRIMQAMPDLMKKVEAATAGLPKMRTEKDLTAADRAKLEALIKTGGKAA